MRLVGVAMAVVLAGATPAFGQEEAEEALDERSEQAAEASEAPARHWYFGPYLRLNWVPIDFFVGFLFDEAPTIFNPGFGATATYRQEDGPSFQVGLGYVSYAVEGAFRNSGDPDVDTEFIESDLALLHVTGSMLWDAEFSDLVALEYGFGLDLGIVLGSLTRSEAYRDPNGDYRPCEGPANPGFSVGPMLYCGLGSAAYDEDGEHYGVEEERVPPVVPLPMLPHLALRITPLPELAVKAEAAFGLVQFWFGLSAAYAPEL